MQTNKKKKPLVYKPYTKGNVWLGSNIRNALKIFCYLAFFTILYVIVGSTMAIGGALVRVLINVAVLFVCGGVLYTNGVKAGATEVNMGEIVHTRLQEGKEVSEKDRKECFHPLRGFVILALVAVPVLMITLPNAFTAQKQYYALQALPSWVESYQGHDEIYTPLDYYRNGGGMDLMSILQLVSRLLVYPFVCMAGTENLDLILLIDRLSPVLALVPALAYPLGYLTGPYERARVHGDIARNTRKHNRRKKKEIMARRAQRQQKKNELI